METANHVIIVGSRKSRKCRLKISSLATHLEQQPARATQTMSFFFELVSRQVLFDDIGFSNLKQPDFLLILTILDVMCWSCVRSQTATRSFYLHVSRWPIFIIGHSTFVVKVNTFSASLLFSPSIVNGNNSRLTLVISKGKSELFMYFPDHLLKCINLASTIWNCDGHAGFNDDDSVNRIASWRACLNLNCCFWWGARNEVIYPSEEKGKSHAIIKKYE